MEFRLKNAAVLSELDAGARQRTPAIFMNSVNKSMAIGAGYSGYAAIQCHSMAGLAASNSLILDNLSVEIGLCSFTQPAVGMSPRPIVAGEAACSGKPAAEIHSMAAAAIGGAGLGKTHTVEAGAAGVHPFSRCRMTARAGAMAGKTVRACDTAVEVRSMTFGAGGQAAFTCCYTMELAAALIEPFRICGMSARTVMTREAALP